MSAENEDVPRMVNQIQGMKYLPEMSAFSYLMIAILIPLLLPLIPIFVLYLVIDWVLTNVGGS
ncbi:MAG: hypothetical protein ABEI06_09700 [Halobacteriaceae archaeon]